MAILSDKRHQFSFEVTPVAPSPEGPHHAYDVIVREKEQILFQRQYTTYTDSPDGHWNVWQLFRALQLADALAVSQTPFSLTGRQDGLFHEPATLSVDVGWLHAVLRSDTLVHRHNQPEPLEEKRSSLIVYLLTGPQELGADSANYKRFWLACQPADVVAFGQTLEAECREALRLRRELGMLAPADEYIDE